MIKEIVLAALGASGFAIIFGMKRKWILIVLFAGGLAWYGYLMLCKLTGKQIPSMFIITVLVVVLAKLITVFVECPVILFSTPILIPFIPGATLYYVMSDLLCHNQTLAANAMLLVYQVGAMALGILVAEMIVIVGKKVIEKGIELSLRIRQQSCKKRDKKRRIGCHSKILKL